MLITASDYSNKLDPVLRPLTVIPREESETAIERLLGDHAERVISRVIAQRFRAGRIGGLRPEEREDLRATAMLRVLQRLRDGDRADHPIANFEGYVATVTLHACDDLLRERMPRRTSAKNRVRYVFGHDRRFAEWNIGDETVCGFREWQGSTHFSATIAADRVRHASGDRDIARTLSAIFSAAGQPVEVDALVNCAAELWQMIDRPTTAIEDEPHAVSTAEPSRDLEHRQFIGKLWDEIRQLNRPQRVALLLNLRDENGPATELFPLLGVASIGEIAETLELPPAQFAPLWRDLPLEDLRIASILGCSRQQVINLRKAARARLSRRMRY